MLAMGSTGNNIRLYRFLYFGTSRRAGSTRSSVGYAPPRIRRPTVASLRYERLHAQLRIRASVLLTSSDIFYIQKHGKGLKRVVDAVHAKGARIFLQIWHAGRQPHPTNTGGVTRIAPSALRSREYAAIRDEKGNISEVDLVGPRALELHEIPGIVERFSHSAKLEKEAGVDGVELHAANGYL
jgi:hypothetical protein